MNPYRQPSLFEIYRRREIYTEDRSVSTGYLISSDIILTMLFNFFLDNFRHQLSFLFSGNSMLFGAHRYFHG